MYFDIVSRESAWFTPALLYYSFYMVVCGPRFEVPTVLPNRTRSFVHDLNQFVADIRTSYTGTTDAPSIFMYTKTRFKDNRFFRAIDPVTHANSIEPSFRNDIEDLIIGSLILSIRATPIDDSVELGILLSILMLVVHYYSSTGLVNPHIPVSICDVEKFVEISESLPDLKNMIKKLFPLFSPCMKSHQLYIDRRGGCSVRDNSADALVRDLSKGEKTGRSVEVIMDPETNHVTLVNAQTGRFIVDVEHLIQSAWISEEARRNIREIVSDLNDVIPPPTDEEFTSEEEQSAHDLLPCENVRKMLRTGRVPKRKQRRVKS